MHNNDDTMMPLNLINFKDSFREDFNSINNSDFNMERYKFKWYFKSQILKVLDFNLSKHHSESI